ncbi:Transcriptional corepressor LEUNIG, partial [Mucuna pruriens]
ENFNDLYVVKVGELQQQHQEAMDESSGSSSSSSNFNYILPGIRNVRFSSSNESGYDVDGGLVDCPNVESCSSHYDTNTRQTNESKAFTFSEVNCIYASTSEIFCSHFSSDGKLLASGGSDKKAVLWYTDSLKRKAILEGHVSSISDVRFSPSMPRLATSSFDTTIRVWDVDNPVTGYSLPTFTAHSAVMSVDFHPNMNDLVCSSDANGDIQYWILSSPNCVRVFKGAINRIRFQPRIGRYLAAAAHNIVSIFDVETQAGLYSLKGHVYAVLCLCWDPSGELLASVSVDSVRVWNLRSGECIRELVSGKVNKFYSLPFIADHWLLPGKYFHFVYDAYDLVLSLVLWNTSESRMLTLPAHDDHITSLAVSTVNGLVASASYDRFIKLW